MIREYSALSMRYGPNIAKLQKLFFFEKKFMILIISGY